MSAGSVAESPQANIPATRSADANKTRYLDWFLISPSLTVENACQYLRIEQSTIAYRSRFSAVQMVSVTQRSFIHLNIHHHPTPQTAINPTTLSMAHHSPRCASPIFKAPSQPAGEEAEDAREGNESAV